VANQTVLDAIVHDESADVEILHPVAEFCVFFGAGAGNVTVTDADDQLRDPIVQIERSQHGLGGALLGSELRRGLGGGLRRALDQQSEQREGDDGSHRPLGYLHLGSEAAAIWAMSRSCGGAAAPVPAARASRNIVLQNGQAVPTMFAPVATSS